MADESSWRALRFDIISTVVGLILLSFLAGSYVTYFEIFPFEPHLQRGFVALEAQREQRENRRKASSSEKPVGYSNKRRYEGRGVVKHVDSKSAPGYTMFTSGRAGAGAELVTADGEVVHRWNCKFSEAYPNPPHIQDPADDPNVVWRKTHLYPDGDVLAILSARFDTDTPNGYGLIRVDAQSNIEWTYDDHAHHDVDVGPDGKIYTLVQEFRDMDEHPLTGVSSLRNTEYGGRVMDDFVVRLSSSGEKLTKFSILDAMEKGGFAETLQGRSYWDILHTNNIDVLGEDFTEHHADLSPGDVVVSFRTLDAVAFIDVENEEMKGMHSGSWRNQHDPDPMPNGELYIYDNEGLGDGSSRILRVDPATGAVRWTYGARPGTDFASKVNGEQDPLPNGNVLVTESKSGRLFEVTPQREVVWDFRIREQVNHEEWTYVPSFFGAKRYEKSYLTFDPREVEASPNCR